MSGRYTVMVQALLLLAIAFCGFMDYLLINAYVNHRAYEHASRCAVVTSDTRNCVVVTPAVVTNVNSDQQCDDAGCGYEYDITVRTASGQVMTTHEENQPIAVGSSATATIFQGQVASLIEGDTDFLAYRAGWLLFGVGAIGVLFCSAAGLALLFGESLLIWRGLRQLHRRLVRRPVVT